MQEGLGQWLRESHGINLCFSTSSMPSQTNSSIELGTRNVTPVPSEKVSANSQAVSNDAGRAEGIDFNRKPVQKPKKKKHRPKVIKEGRSAKTQKSTTPKPPKEKGNESTGKRKYVRRKGLNTPAKQPPSEDVNTHNKAEPSPARRCLNFNGEDRQENADLVLQAQVTVVPTGPVDPQSSISAVERTHVQIACHWGGTSSSISASVDPMANVQELQADRMSNGLIFDLNNSSNQMPSKRANLMDSSGQFFQSGPRETVKINQLLDFHAGMPGKSVFHLDSSVNQMQNSSADFGPYLGPFQSSTEKAPRPDHHGYMMPENIVAHPQHTKMVSIRGNFNSEACTREPVIINQMIQAYRVAESPIAPTMHSEWDAINGNLNEFAVKNDYLKFGTNQNNHIGAPFGLYDSCDFSHVPAMGKKREHNAINGPRISLDMNFEQSNNARPFCNDPHCTSSLTPYFPETCKKMRSDNHKNWLNGAMGKFSSSSAYLPNNWNTNEVSAINSGVRTLADVQRLMALEKSQSSQRMIGFEMSEINIVERPNMVQQHKNSTLHNTSNKAFIASPDKQLRYFTPQDTQLPESTMNSLGENNTPNNIQRIGNHQLQSLEIRPTLHYSTGKDCVTLPDKQSRYLTAEHTKLPSGTANPLIENYIPSNGIHHLQYLENSMGKGPDLVAVTHNASTYDTMNNYCFAIPDEQIRNTSAEAVGSPSQAVSQSTRTEHYHLAASRETKAANLTKKPKVRGRPRKEAEPNGKPKGRGRRKENVDRAKCILSKGRHTDPLNSDGICCGSEPSTGITPNVATLESERNEERTSNILETSDHDKYGSIGSKQIHAESISEVIAVSVDPLDAIIQKLKLLNLNKSDKVVAAIPKNTLDSYKGESGALVPFVGHVKKRRSRAKVNIDPVTTLVWNLLMGLDMSDGAEGMDKNKENWLDEERRVFRGRIDSFIARMHLVQGDRRFSPWKGSVVDSVVGVFLTQNVSDHLSSSAFMAVAAKFPAKPETPEKPAAEMSHTPPEQKDSCSELFGHSIKLQGKFSVEEISDIRSLISTEENEGSNSNELIGSSSGDGVKGAAGECSVSYRKSLTRLHENGPPGFVVPASGIASVVEAEDVSLEDVISSQNSAVSSQNSPDYLFSRTDTVGSSSLPYFTEEDCIMRNMSNGMASSTTYTELPQIQDLENMHNAKCGSSEYHGDALLPVPGVNKDVLLDLNRTYQPVHSSVSYAQNGQFDFTGVPYASHLDKSFCTGLDRANHSNVTQSEASFYRLPPSSITANKNKTQMADYSSNLLYSIDGSLVQERSRFPSEPSLEADFSSIIKQNYQPLISSKEVPFSREHSFCENSFSRNETDAPSVEQHGCSNLQEVYTTRTKQMGGDKSLAGCSQQENDLKVQAKTCEKNCSPNLCKNQNAHSEVSQGVASDLIGKSKDTQKGPSEVPTDESKTKKVRGRPNKKDYDWDNLRKEMIRNGGDNRRSHNAKDSVDWEAVRQADVKEISETIRERGMNNMLAERIKEFLNRLVRDHGSIDLEWLRDVQPDKAKDYLLSIRGLGLKSVECVRLLTLHHMAFPVDTNVGRICVRLGWVPLQPLPESLQLHLLELYPMLEHIQKYLWPRLCNLDQLTLYELHYQMITFGKVFCTKSKPNCNSCPMRAECKHFASAFASARLALPGPEEKSLVASEASNAAASCHHTYLDSRPAGQLEWSANHREHVISGNHQPIIEEPSSPEPEPQNAETKEGAIEDLFSEDPDEIPTINLNIEEFTQNLKSYMQANNIEIEDADMSKALVAITPEAASIPTPKLKNVSRLRTEHQVYELPDSHPLLEGFDPRQPDDPCPYLLSIWTPGETAQSTDAPKTFCNSEETGKLCKSSTCFSCNSIREMQAQKVRGTIMIPCRTAMRGSFPLNGTYFQVNEVFADHYSSQNPIDVPRSWIWNLPRRTVYFGTSIPTIFRGLTTEEIQQCFWRGFVCVRGFDTTLRAPRPLYARLHFPASKVTRGKRPAAAREEE